MKVMNAKIKVKHTTGTPSYRTERKVCTQKERKTWEETEEMNLAG
jgi:hypothetical protein